MAFPYQCIIARNSFSGEPNVWTLVGASGSTLVVQSSNGARSVWPQQLCQTINHSEEKDESDEPPGKRIKLSPPKELKSNFSSLILSNNNQYLVGVTGEDKCIRVFSIDSQSQLQLLSERCMTRRPSSITMTSDDSMILCADKFGDVYALPLLPSPDDEQPESANIASTEVDDKDFIPSATVFTVHSGRNRKTLEDQLKQKAKGPLKTKEVMSFRHDLLLGHVSMLTDLAHAKVGDQSYIITADRDEHIRVSRSLPQAHIIEGFCFGHEEFVSRLCLMRSGLLVSGGGDAQLFVWDWQNYRLVTKLPICDTARQHLKSRAKFVSSSVDDASFKVAVTGIWETPSSGNEQENEIFVTCEGLPAIFSFKFGSGGMAAYSIPLDGNALAVAFIETSRNSWTTVVSVDNVHEAGSTSQVRITKNALRLQCLVRQVDGQWREDRGVGEALKWLAEGDSERPNLGPGDDKAIRDILYHVENLRKRPGAEDGGGT
ncbi:guanine-N(7)--methyltransferase subunit TRM82 [Phaeosphaeriaceae sp. PMI808]|nr:guanine-N(7)--methyltransferase subunit TRM82 [Phaeosphaeriaceae sp. PMI808]